MAREKNIEGDQEREKKIESQIDFLVVLVFSKKLCIAKQPYSTNV